MPTLSDLQNQAATALQKYNASLADINSAYSSMSTIFNTIGSCYNKGSNNTLDAQLSYGQMNLQSCCDHLFHTNAVVNACKSAVNSFNAQYNAWMAAKSAAVTNKGILDSANAAVTNFINTDPATVADQANASANRLKWIFGIVVVLVIAFGVFAYFKWFKK